MKVFRYFYLFIFFSGILFSQSPKISCKNFYICSGNIGDSEISMYLYINGNNITGKYYYKTINQFIHIKGTLYQNELYLEERINNRITGYFKGYLSDDFVFSGQWSSYDSDNKYDFKFTNNKSYPINNLEIITSSLETDFNDKKFESSKDAVIIKNQKNLDNLDKISVDVDGIQSLNHDRVEFLLNDSVSQEYDTWKISSYSEDDFYMRKEINVSYLDNNIISFSLYNYSYTGGMHGIYNTVSSIYLISSGERIGQNLSELIENKNDIELINLMRRKLLRNYTDKDFFDFYSIELSNIYDITPYGIKFIWPLYKIAGYAQGIIEIDFTYLELKPFIKKDSKFYYLFDR